LAFVFWYLVLGAWYLVLGFWYLVFVFWCLVFGIWCLVLGIWYLVFVIWCLLFVTWHFENLKHLNGIWIADCPKQAQNEDCCNIGVIRQTSARPVQVIPAAHGTSFNAQ
jgi:hypothetical protein